MPATIQFVTFTPSDEYKASEDTFKEFASWILPASRGTFLGKALHGIRVGDENVAHILFHAASVRDLVQLGKDRVFEVEAYYRIATLCKVKDPLSMSLVYVEFEDDWDTIKPLLEAPVTEFSIVTAEDSAADAFAKTKGGHLEFSRFMHGLNGTVGKAVFGTVVVGAENTSLVISAWKTLEAHTEAKTSEALAKFAGALPGAKAEVFHTKFSLAP